MSLIIFTSQFNQLFLHGNLASRFEHVLSLVSKSEKHNCAAIENSATSMSPVGEDRDEK